jgi:hypothetical protein
MKTQKLVMDLLVSGQLAQSKLENALILKSEIAGKNSPRLGADLMYLKTLCGASKCG